MPLELGPRLHAFTHNLFRLSDECKVDRIYSRLKRRLSRHGLLGEDARDALARSIANTVLDTLGLEADHPQSEPICSLTKRLLVYEELFMLPTIDWDTPRSVAEWWDLRHELERQYALTEHLEEKMALFREAIVDLLAPIFNACPALVADHQAGADLTILTDLAHNLGATGSMLDSMVDVVGAEEVLQADLFTRLHARLERNLVVASGGNPARPEQFTRIPKMPSASGIQDSAKLVATYLKGTPLHDYFDQQVAFSIPTAARFEHHHIVAGSGHGKTQTLQYMIGEDLAAVAAGNRSIVVFDSQGDLIRNIASLAEFAPGGVLHGRIVLIDPSDVEYPVSLNLFDVGIGRLNRYSPLERERLTNSILELYDFVLGSLLAAEMTQKQSVVFRYVTRLMLHIPNATIHTLRALMEPNGAKVFADDIAKLSGIARDFFATEFTSREFEQTKKQVVRRLWGILENQTFERMFSHPRSKLDLFSEMNAGKVILINTAKDLLKEQGSEIFGRFFIAMIAQAAQERATLPEAERMPTFVYIDEAADYFDQNIGVILAQARKYHVGMVLAHQYLGQLEPRLQDAFAANTSIKFAGGVSAKDARVLSSMFHCDTSFIEQQPKGSFAVHIRSLTPSAVPLRFPFGHLERKPTMSAPQKQALRTTMRKRYAHHYTDLPEHSTQPSAGVTPTQERTETRTPKQETKQAAKKKPQKGTEPRQHGGEDTDAGFSL